MKGNLEPEERVMNDSMPNPNQLWIDMQKLNALYEELCWGYDDELNFCIEGDTIIISNKTQDKN